MVEAVRLVAGEKISLIMVCNSCEEKQYARLVDMLRLVSNSVPVLRLDEDSSSWIDPAQIISVIRAALPQDSNFEMTKKPPQSVQTSTMRKCKP